MSEANWKRLTVLCDAAHNKPAKLTGDELREFVKLYRRVSADLAYARTKSTNQSLIDFLNDLTGRAYGILYRQPRESVVKSLLATIAFAAQTVRRRKWFVFISAIIFFGSAFVAMGLMSAVPDTREFFVPAGFESAFDQWKSGSFHETTGDAGAMATGFYASNNPRTAIITGAVGAGTFGLMSIQLLFTNGAILGTLVHELIPVGRVDYLLSSIFAHGVPELSGIIMSGASGLLLASALVFPGRNRRRDALKLVGTDAICLLGISVALMFCAAPIEAYFSFNSIVPGFVKVCVGSVELVAWISFWTFYGRTAEEK